VTFWRRTPRSVYQVYDEERYLAGEDAPGGVSEPAGAVGPVGDEREQMQAQSHGPRVVRLLALGLLGVVTAAAAIIVAVQMLHHTKAVSAPIAARRDHTRSVWTPSQPPVPAWRAQPGSITRTVRAAPVASAPIVPAAAPPSSAATSSRGFGGSGGTVVSPPTPLTRSSAGIADAASWPTSELPPANGSPSANGSLLEGGSSVTSVFPPTNESHVDGEFGFER
jgi:hypothetical protein